MAIVNYGVIGLIQLELGFCDKEDLDMDKAIQLYDRYVAFTRELI